MFRSFFCMAYNNSCNLKYALSFPLMHVFRDGVICSLRLEYGTQDKVAGRLGHRLDSPVEERDFFMSRAYRLVLRRIQPPT